MTVTSLKTENTSARGVVMAQIKARLPYVLALLLFGLGIFALYHLLAPVDIHAVADQIRSTPWRLSLDT